MNPKVPDHGRVRRQRRSRQFLGFKMGGLRTGDQYRHDAAIKAKRLCGPFAWKEPRTSPASGRKRSRRRTRRKAELGGLANTQPKPKSGPFPSARCGDL
jgi:hypothetical protein